jgi:hypothetical protein
MGLTNRTAVGLRPAIRSASVQRLMAGNMPVHYKAATVTSV